MTSNPFRFATPTGESFLLGRQKEQAALVAALNEGRNLVLVGPRGCGKTSLLRAALAEARAAGLDTAYADLLPAINTRRFAEIYAAALTLEPNRTVEDVQEAMQHLVPRFRPRVTITGDGRPGLQLDLWNLDRDIRALLERILEAPAELRQRRQRPLAVVFDDFEDLWHSAEAALLRDLTAAARRHLDVGYVFVLRRRSTLEATFEKPRSPFYRLAETFRLGPLPADLLREGLARRMEQAGIGAADGVWAELVDLADGIPHYVQMLAHALFEEVRDETTATLDHLRAALGHVLESQAYAFKMQWETLSPFQRNLALAIAQGHTDRLHSQRMVTRLGLGSPSTVSKNLKALAEREVLQRDEAGIRFIDPFFGLWLQRRMT